MNLGLLADGMRELSCQLKVERSERDRTTTSEKPNSDRIDSPATLAGPLQPAYGACTELRLRIRPARLSISLAQIARPVTIAAEAPARKLFPRIPFFACARACARVFFYLRVPTNTPRWLAAATFSKHPDTHAEWEQTLRQVQPRLPPPPASLEPLQCRGFFVGCGLAGSRGFSLGPRRHR